MELDEVTCGLVVSEPRGRWELRAYSKSDAEPIVAFLVLARDVCGEPADVVAFRGDWIATWDGYPVLGAERIHAPRLSDGLVVHVDIWSWLAANRDGIVILDERGAADMLDGVPLRVATAAHAAKLRHRLARPAPPIAVRSRAAPSRALAEVSPAP